MKKHSSNAPANCAARAAQYLESRIFWNWLRLLSSMQSFRGFDD